MVTKLPMLGWLEAGGWLASVGESTFTRTAAEGTTTCTGTGARPTSGRAAARLVPPSSRAACDSVLMRAQKLPVSRSILNTLGEVSAICCAVGGRLGSGRMATPEEPREWVSNLHDAYMNANLVRDKMQAEPVERDPDAPELAFITPRFRLERMWHTFLYVVVEAWRSATSDQKSLVQAVVPDEFEQVERLLRAGDDLGCLEHLRSTRDYMCHRDRREYWDRGRMAVAVPGMFHWALALDRAFAAMTLKALQGLQSSESPADP